MKKRQRSGITVMIAKGEIIALVLAISAVVYGYIVLFDIK